MIRKDFIKSASLLLGGAALTPLSGLTAAPTVGTGPLVLKKALGYAMIEEDLPLVDKLMLVRDLGFDGVEFNSPLDFGIDEILRAKEKSGIQTASTVNKDHWSKPLSDPDATKRSFIVDSIARSLEETRQLGGDTVLVVPGVVNDKVSYEQAYRTAQDSIRQLIPYVEKSGVKVGLENVWNNFILSPVEAKRFVEEIGHPLIGWYFDIGNVLRYGWPEHWIQTLGSHIFKLHIKEFSREKMNKEGLWKGFDVEIGKGDINWPAVMQSLREVGHSGGWITAEVKGGDRHHLRKIALQIDEVMK